MVPVGLGKFLKGEDCGDDVVEVPFRGFDSAETQMKSTACTTAHVCATAAPKRSNFCLPLASFKELKAKQIAEKKKSDVPDKQPVERKNSVDCAKQSLRFGEVTTESELDKLSVKQFAETMDQKISWAINMFKEWRMNRLRVGPYDNTHGTLQWVNVEDSGNLLKPHLCLALCCFLNEIQWKDGKPFPGKSLMRFSCVFNSFWRRGDCSGNC